MRFTTTDLRALQARGLKITQQTGKKKHAESYAGRGMGLQELVAQANEQYRQLGIASIWEFGAEAKWIPGGKLVPRDGTVDFIGLWDGRGVAFDAKETAEDSLPAANVKTHQVEFLMDYAKAGGIAFLLVAYTGPGRFFVVPIEKYFFPIWASRRGLIIEEAKRIGREVWAGRVCLDYLKGLESNE